MKKYFLLGMVLVATIGFFLLNQEPVYGIVISESQEGNEEIIELSQDEKDFFNKMKLKQQYENEGFMIVDTINGDNKDSIEIDGVTYEKSAIAHRIYQMNMKGELDSFLNEFWPEMSNSSKEYFTSIQETSLEKEQTYSNIYRMLLNEEMITENHNLICSLFNTATIIDSSSYDLMADYYYRTIYEGYYEDYDEDYTYAGTYSIEAEYYLYLIGSIEVDYKMEDNGSYTHILNQTINEGEYLYKTYAYNNSKRYDFYSSDGEYFYKFVYGWNIFSEEDDYHEKYKVHYLYNSYQNIFTGVNRYTLNEEEGFSIYQHSDIIQFDYQTYFYLSEGISSPNVTITLIYDYWGKEKMIIEFDDWNYPFKLTREEHYNRNEYNKDCIANGVWVNASDEYPEESDIDNSEWEEYDDWASYFHQILEENNDNSKYIKEIQYYDLNVGAFVYGQSELVYDENGDIEFEDLVTFTFNFGLDITDPGSESCPDAHYIMDVYPYLVWGNTYADSQNYTAYERFIWDKDSVSGNPYVFWSDPQGQNVFGSDLIELYEDGDIGNQGGEQIDSEIINVNNFFEDTIPPTFDYISTQYISEYQYANFDWTSIMENVDDNLPCVVETFEIYDYVNYHNEGTYTVKVGARDDSGNVTSQIFNVIVTPYVSGC